MPKDTNPLLRRKSSSPFSSLPRGKPNSRKTSLADEDTRLDDSGLIPSLAPPNVRQHVLPLIRHIQARAFDDVPDRAAGMGSERIAELLRFRRALPPIVSLAHLHALSRSSTDTERELASLIKEGRVRKLTIPGRGRGGAAVGDGVVVVEDWAARVRQEASLDPQLQEKYIDLLSIHRASPTAPATSLSPGEERALVSAGFLTSPTAFSASLDDLFSSPDTSSSLATISSAGSRAATGTLAAIGGAGAVHESGGGGSMLATRDSRPSASAAAGQQRQMTFALPATGAYLKLLVAARQHLLQILRTLSPKYREATVGLLKEKWDGNTPNDAVSRLKRERGEWAGVLPGKTKRWRDFYGMRFECVLGECVGGGLVELFDTGSVGMAVRGR